jgi:hypothetical protein
MSLKDAPVLSYEVDHVEAFTKLGLTWPPEFSQAFASKTECLTRRMAEVLWLLSIGDRWAWTAARAL